MFKKLIWPNEAKCTQGQSPQASLPIPEHVTIVIMQRVGDAMTARVSEEISADAAQSLCKTLLKKAPQLGSADQAQRTAEDHGAAFTSALDRTFSVVECTYFHGEDFFIENYSAMGQWVESRFGELDGVCLDFVEASASQPFAVCVCY